MKTLEKMKTLDRVRESYVPEKVIRQTEDKMQWFRNAKLGMFIHWGLYSMLGKGEWVLFHEKLNISEYAALANEFSAPAFDAGKWAKTAKKAGMKYMVLTTRHHDGFSLFQSEASSYNSVNSAAGKDFVREYVQACRNEGLKVGFYYSPMDWRYPGYFFPEMYWENALEMKRQCWEQLRELMSNYGKIDMLWFDGEWLAHGGIDWGADGWERNPDWIKSKFMNVNYFWESEKLINMIRSLQPDIMINNRGGWSGDFHVRERYIGEIRTDMPWDSNDCIAGSWGYVPDKPILSLAQLIHNLVTIVVRDGNYLLNIGPDGKGQMDSEQTARLSQLGDWLATYGDSIYNTRGGPILPGRWGGTTYRGKTMYIHIIEWEQDQICFPSPGKVVSFSSPNCRSFSVTCENKNIEIEVPIKERDPYDTIIQLDFKEDIQWSGHAGKEQDIYGLADGLDNPIEVK